MTQQPPSVNVIAAQLCAAVPGGTGRYSRELVTALSRTAEAGAEVTATATRGCPSADSLPVDVTRVPYPYPVLARLWERGLPPVLRCDVIHAPTLMVPTVSRSSALVVTIHDVVPWTHPETLTRHGVAFHHRMARRAAERADAIVTPTEAVAGQVRRLISPPCRVLAVGQGRSPLTVPPDASERRARVGAEEGYLLFVGTVEPRKGLDVLLDALAQPGLSRTRLVVVGPPGWGGVDVASEATARGIEARVTVTGRVDDDSLASLYQGAAAVVVPSRAEGFGLPLLEAMALGIPVVTSDDPALVEVGAGAAAVVPVGSAEALARELSAVLGSVERREAMTVAGLGRAQDFTWTDVATRLWGLYAELTRRAQGTGM